MSLHNLVLIFIVIIFLTLPILGVVSLQKNFHLKIIKYNPYKNKTIIIMKNTSKISIKIIPNGSVNINIPSDKETIVEESFPKNFSKCIDRNISERYAMKILLNDKDSRDILSELIKKYNDIVIEFHAKQGFIERENERIIFDKICLGELIIYPKDFFLRNIILNTEVDFINKRLQKPPCEKTLKKFCIRYINPKFRKPTVDEIKFIKRILRKNGYEYNKMRMSIAVTQLYTALPNGSIIPSSAIYWIILEPYTSKNVYRAIILDFNSNKTEDINVRYVYIISNIS